MFRLKAIAIFFLVCCCHGQELYRSLPVSTDKALINDIGIAHETVAQADSRRKVATAMRTFLEVHFEEIRSVCKPSKGQLANLETAAEAAVDEAMAEWIVDVAKASIAAKQRQPDRDAARKHALWSSAVTGLLDANQKKLLKLHWDERSSFYKSKKGIVEAMVLLDLQLLFDSSQREQLARLFASSGKQIKFVDSSELHLSKDLEKQIVARLTKAQKAKWAELTKEAFDSSLEIHVK